MTATAWIVFWWLTFGTTHILLAHWRQGLIQRLGRKAYALSYTAVALATFLPLVWVFLNNRHGGDLLWAAPGWLQHSGMALSLLGIALIPAALLRSSPVGMIHRPPQAQGLIRITRHPLFMGFGLWGLGHCLMQGFVNDVLFFGGFTAFAIVGCAHQDARKRREAGARLGDFMAETSLLPFVAIVSGRNRLVLSEMPWLLLALGLLLGLGLYQLHPWLFG